MLVLIMTVHYLHIGMGTQSGWSSHGRTNIILDTNFLEFKSTHFNRLSDLGGREVRETLTKISNLPNVLQCD